MSYFSPSIQAFPSSPSLTFGLRWAAASSELRIQGQQVLGALSLPCLISSHPEPDWCRRALIHWKGLDPTGKAWSQKKAGSPLLRLVWGTKATEAPKNRHEVSSGQPGHKRHTSPRSAISTCPITLGAIQASEENE